MRFFPIATRKTRVGPLRAPDDSQWIPGWAPAWPFVVFAVVLFGFRSLGGGALPAPPTSSPPVPTAPSSSPQAQAAALKQEAVEVAKQAAEAYPNEALSYVLLGSAYYNLGQSEIAIQHLKRGLELSPNQTEAYELLARAAYEKGDMADCIQLSQDALKHGPPTPELLNRRGRAELDLGLTREATRTLEQASSLPNATSESHYLLGQAQLQSGNYAQAREKFQRTIELVPDHTQAYFGLFTACLRLGQSEDAARYRQQFSKLEEADRRTHTDRSVQGDALTGLPMVRETVARTLFGAAQVHRTHGQLERTVVLLKRCASLDLENTMYRAALESLFLQRKAPAEGLAIFQELTARQPESSMNHLFLGRFQARMQDYNAAESSYRKVMELTPERPEGHRSLADLFYRTNRQLGEATTLARRTVELEPSGSNYHLLALVHLKNNDRTSALEAARQAVARSPADPKYQQLLNKLESAPSPGSPP